MNIQEQVDQVFQEIIQNKLDNIQSLLPKLPKSKFQWLHYYHSIKNYFVVVIINTKDSDETYALERYSFEHEFRSSDFTKLIYKAELLDASIENLRHL